MSLPDVMRPRGLHRLYRLGVVRRLAERHFHRAYYYRAEDTVLDCHWLGTPAAKLPLDLWMYQEIMTELRPALVIETGTFCGGSALFMASVMDQLGHGRVMTIDVRHAATVPVHPRIEYVLGSSIEPEIANRARAAAAEGGPVVVVLDSLHTYEHVLAELSAYADLVTPGSYCIVEDTNVDGHPVLPAWGPGPMRAVDEFLAGRPDFLPDPRRERFMLTMNPRGYLRRAAQ